jgi:hypothetical protein
MASSSPVAPVSFPASVGPCSQRLFPDRQDLELFYVGEDYSVAASLGALANVLAVHRPAASTSPTKPATHAKPGNLADATFIGTPVTDIYLAWKRGQAHEDEVLVLGP